MVSEFPQMYQLRAISFCPLLDITHFYKKKKKKLIVKKTKKKRCNFLIKKNSNELVTKCPCVEITGLWGRKQNITTEFGIKTSEQGGSEREPKYKESTSVAPPPPNSLSTKTKTNPPTKKRKIPCVDVITVHKCKRHTVFATLAPKSILYNFNNHINENKESGKTFETLRTQCQSSSNRGI